VSETVTANLDEQWYAATYPDVVLSGLSPSVHYEVVGRLLGRPHRAGATPEPSRAFAGRRLADEPSPRFDLDAYMLCNEEVPKDDRAALAHRAANIEKPFLVSWLDNYIQSEFSQETRLRVGSLLDVLLTGAACEEGSPSRTQHLRRLKDRLAVSLANWSPTEGSADKASIVIPVYNQIFYTAACAISLFESNPAADIELLVANDCSTDETEEFFRDFAPRIRCVRPESNLGFLRNCNHAGRQATGNTVIMLNNDTVVMPGWLDSLVETLRDKSCGMAGSKLLNLNGTLQEAGAIYWKDGSAWNFGRGRDPRSFEFGYRKEVDYCSGASIALRTEDWNRLGGFDEHFAPAYCEEVDLAFRLREKLGLVTVFQPRSVMVHHEGVSHGRDVAVGIKSYQAQNQKKFFARWSEVLVRDHFNNAENVFLARDRSRRKPHMLFVDHSVPTPDCDAGSRQMDFYLKLFVRLGYQITFWPDNLGYDPVNTSRYEQMGIEVASFRAGVVSLEDWIKENGRHLQVAFLSRAKVASKYLSALRDVAPACLKMFYGHDLHAERVRFEMQFSSDPALEEELAEAEKCEKECWSLADFVSYPSQEECDHVAARRADCKTVVLPLYCTAEAEALRERTQAGFGDRKGLLFVGSFNHRPNADGVLWFVREVLPLIKKTLPDVSLVVAGANPPAEVAQLEVFDPAVRIAGRVSDGDLAKLYENSRLAVAPLRFGAGVKGKVVESLMKGLPVITTSVGIQGLPESAAAIAAADDPQGFAAKVVELYRNQAAWKKQREAGFRYFKANFTEPAVLRHLETWLPRPASTSHSRRK